jgi:hypothetical protein
MTKRNTRPAVAHMQKVKAEPRTNLPSLSKARLKELIEEAAVDAYGEEEQPGGFFTMIEEHLALPFRVKVLGVDADLEKVDMTLDGQIVAICRRGKNAAEDPNPGPAFADAGTSRRGMDCRLSPLAPRVLVSEYQDYDFRAVDRPLTRNEMAALPSISTRPAITTASFTNPVNGAT